MIGREAAGIVENFLAVLANEPSINEMINKARAQGNDGLFTRVFNKLPVEEIIPEAQFQRWINQKKQIIEGITDHERSQLQVFMEEEKGIFPTESTAYKKLEELQKEIINYVYANFLTASAQLHPALMEKLSEQKDSENMTFTKVEKDKMVFSLMEVILGEVDVSAYNMLGDRTESNNFVNPVTDSNWLFTRQAQKIITTNASPAKMVSELNQSKLDKIQKILQAQILDLQVRKDQDPDSQMSLILRERERALVNLQVHCMNYFNGEINADRLCTYLNDARDMIKAHAGKTQKPEAGTTGFLARHVATLAGGAKKTAKKMANVAGKVVGKEIATSGSLNAVEEVMKIIDAITRNERAVARAAARPVATREEKHSFSDSPPASPRAGH